MRFTASEMPGQSTRSLDGRVHSVFRRVVNVRLATGDILALYANDDARQPPGAISFAAPADFDFCDHLSHNAAISCRAGILRIAGSDISIDLRHARQYPRTTIEPSGASTDANFASSWRTAWQTLLSAGGDAGLVVSLNGKQAAGALDAALAGRARQTVPWLLEAAQENDTNTAVEAATRLVGAGPGLTPSGDDFLAGFLVGARHIAQDRPQLAFVGTLGEALSTQYATSGDIACAYLTHAAAGRAARPLSKLAERVAQGANEDAIQAAAIAAMHMGHSSGADGTFGLLCGLAAWRSDLAATISAGLTQ